MPKFVLANDIHASLRNPVSRIDSYHDAIFGKLDQILRLAIKIQASAILLAGDIFHEKTRVPISLVFEIFHWCIKAKQAGIRVIAIPGNHDLQNDRYDSLPSQPLGLLFLAGAMEDVSFRVADVDGVDVVGIPYPAAKMLSAYDGLPKNASDRSILLSHCFALPSAGEYFGEPIIGYGDLINLPYRVFHFGHDHRDNGVTKLEDRWFVNVGSISRGALSNENIGRDVKCVIVDYGEEGPTVTQLRLMYKPASEVFDLALRAQKERERNDIEQFVEGLTEDLSDVSPVNFKDKLQVMEVPDSVRKRVLEYIEEAETAS